MEGEQKPRLFLGDGILRGNAIPKREQLTAAGSILQWLGASC